MSIEIKLSGCVVANGEVGNKMTSSSGLAVTRQLSFATIHFVILGADLQGLQSSRSRRRCLILPAIHVPSLVPVNQNSTMPQRSHKESL